MATVAVLAWKVDGQIDPLLEQAIERFHGHLHQSGIALFPGAADALAAAVSWQHNRQAARSPSMSRNSTRSPAEIPRP